MQVTESNSPLQIVALGGLGEIGMNMMAYQCGDDIVVVDCGLMFPEPDMLGIDYVIPDITWLRERSANVRAICLTHGHEDHIGALPFVLQELNVPVYGTALTLGFVNEKLKEYKLDDVVELVTVKPRDSVTLGCFCVEFLRVVHPRAGDPPSRLLCCAVRGGSGAPCELPPLYLHGGAGKYAPEVEQVCRLFRGSQRDRR